MNYRSHSIQRLIIVTEEMTSPHGTQMLASLLIDQAVTAGFEVVSFTPQYDSKSSAWAEFLKERNVKVSTSGFWWLTRWYLPHRVLARRLWRFVRDFRPQLIWSPDNEPMTCCALECQPKNSPPFFVHDPSDGRVEFGTYPRLWSSVCHRVTGLSVHGRRQLAKKKKLLDLITAKREGFGLVVLEMLSRKRPVIAGDVGSSREVLGEFGAGWVVPPQDLIALAEQMKVLCDRPHLIEQMGTRAQAVWNSHFTPPSMFERYLAFWRECGAGV